MAKIETQSFPRPCNVMPAILNACRRRPRTYDYLESVTGSTRGSLHVLVKRMRDRGLLTAIDGGTHDVQHVATKRGR